MPAKSLIVTYGADASKVRSALNDIDSAHAATAAKAVTTGSTVSSAFTPATKAFGLAKSSLGEFGAAFGPVGEGAEKLKTGLEHVKESWEHSEGASKKAGIALVGTGAAVTGVGAAFAAMGHGVETAHVTLEQVLKNQGSSWEEYGGKINQAITHQEKFGHSSADTQTAMAKLTAGLGDPKKALDEMSLASEIAAFKHISLADAAGLVVKVHAGSGKVLKEFGINAKEAGNASKELEAATKAVEAADTASAKASENLANVHTLLAGKKKLTASETISLHKAEEADTAAAEKSDDAHKKLAQAQDAVKNATAKGSAESQLQAKLHGVAEAQAHTFGGEMKALETKVKDVAATFGAKFGPELVKLGPLLMFTGAVLESGVIPGLIGAATATWAWTAALLANPVTWIVLAIIALGVAIYELITHWSAVIKFLGEFWSTVTGLVGDGINAVLGFFARLPGEVWGFVSDMGARVLAFLAELPAKMAFAAGWAIGEYIRFWLELPGRVWGVLMTLWGFMEAFVPMALGWAVDLGAKILHGIWDGIISLPGMVWDLLVGGGGLLGSIASAIPGIAGKALELGGKILSGIWDTIKDIPGKIPGMLEDVVRAILGAAGKLWDAAKHVATQIWDGFKKGLGISSPSFLERAMESVITGVKGHVETLGGLVSNVNGMVAAPTLAGAVPVAIGAGGPVSGGAPSIYLTINVAGSVVSDRQLTETAYRGLLEIKRREGSLGLA